MSTHAHRPRAKVIPVPLRCRCGALRGTLELRPTAVLRVVCYCDDCQAYASWLEREDVLDAYGGTEAVQARPAWVRITGGADQLACMRLSSRGLMRWYARCCRTPVANTLASPRMPFVGVLQAALDLDGATRDAVLGPAARTQGRFAIGGVPEGAAATASLGTIARSVLLLARGWLSGGHRPSPFFDRETGAPSATPEVLTSAERDRLRPPASARPTSPTSVARP